jgi:hypothetical protein
MSRKGIRNRCWTEVDRQWLKQNYRTLGYKRCARLLHRTRHAVMKEAQRGGYARHHVLDGLHKFLLTLYRQHLVDAEIAEAVEARINRPCHPGTIWMWRKAHQLPTNCPNASKEHGARVANVSKRARLLSLHEEGINDAKKARIMGVTKEAVSSMRRRMGLPRIGQEK